MRQMNLPIFSRIESIMSGNDAGQWPILRRALSIVSIGYGLVVQHRRKRFDVQHPRVQKLPCPVISVGNITLGGTGKSPMTVYIARFLQHQGLRPAVLSRGYRGGAEKTGGVVSDGVTIRLAADMAGDEPLMMAHQLKGVPILVGKDRYKSGMKAILEFSVNVLVLDDAFQHHRLFRDINLVLLDHEQPFGNGRVVPAGPLREPVPALRAADAILLTRYKMDGASHPVQPSGIAQMRQFVPYETPIFRSGHRACIRGIWPASCRTHPSDLFSTPPVSDITLSGNCLFAFSGIARNADFRESVQNMGYSLAGFLAYSDHHHYSPRDIDHILGQAADVDADMLVTTEKDACRLAGQVDWPLPLGIVGIDIAFQKPDDAAFLQFLQDRLALFSRFGATASRPFKNRIVRHP